MPKYFVAYEKAFELPIYRPVKVLVVCDRGDRFRIETDVLDISARGIINATGTWETPYIPTYPGADRFRDDNCTRWIFTRPRTLPDNM